MSISSKALDVNAGAEFKYNYYELGATLVKLNDYTHRTDHCQIWIVNVLTTSF